MPDDEDYAWLGRLIAHPERWSASDLRAAEFVLDGQRQAFESLHPLDRAGRRRARELIDQLAEAIEIHRATS